MRAAAQGSTAADRLPAPVRTAVDRLADSARAAHLPIDPLYAKAAEGVLKGADEARIVAAVRGLEHELAGARVALGDDATPAELVAGASALHVGADPAALRRAARLRTSRPPASSLVVPLVVYADMLSRKVSPEVATGTVTALMERGAPDADFSALRAAVERDIASGQAPDLAARARTDAVIRDLGPARLRPPAEQ